MSNIETKSQTDFTPKRAYYFIREEIPLSQIEAKKLEWYLKANPEISNWHTRYFRVPANVREAFSLELTQHQSGLYGNRPELWAIHAEFIGITPYIKPPHKADAEWMEKQKAKRQKDIIHSRCSKFTEAEDEIWNKHFAPYKLEMFQYNKTKEPSLINFPEDFRKRKGII
jgi:hypothetical protein